MKKFFALLLFGICFVHSFAQENAPKKAALGTYQFIIENSKQKVAFADDVLYEIEKARDEKEIKFLQLNSQAKVKILPKVAINAKDFIPLKEEVVYIER